MRTGVKVANFGLRSSRNVSEHIDNKVSGCGGDARHEIKLGTCEDASIHVEINTGGIWEHKDIALRCKGPEMVGAGSNWQCDTSKCVEFDARKPLGAELRGFVREGGEREALA